MNLRNGSTWRSSNDHALCVEFSAYDVLDSTMLSRPHTSLFLAPLRCVGSPCGRLDRGWAPLSRVADRPSVIQVNNPGVKFQRVTFGSRAEVKQRIEIAPNEVHVWGFLLDVDAANLTSMSRNLSTQELERGKRLASEQHRRRFVAAHATLRQLLSLYCGPEPGDLVIQTTPAGKPFLQDKSAIRFNLTHSHGRALVALAREREVGIDLEKIRPEVDVSGLAKRFLSSRDQAFVDEGDPIERQTRFLKIWVAREAVFKADGKGITFPLHHDHVELSDDGTRAYLVRGDGGDKTNMPVRFLSLDSGWIGALAAEGLDWTVGYRSFPES